jgi:predicted aldo/keto reductase-like oxidoreductase
LITSLGGKRASPLGLAAHPQQDSRCVARAFRNGINYFFCYGPGSEGFLQGIGRLFRRQREEAIFATGSGSRTHIGMLTARRKMLKALHTECIDAFFAEYITAAEDQAAVFGEGGVLDELQKWKSAGWIRFTGATTHDRQVAKQLALDPRVDLLMHRLNMAHRKAVSEVFPSAIRTRTPIIAFTATRWGTLLDPCAAWPGPPPTAADCYRYCLAHPAVHVVLTAPQTIRELNENLSVLQSPGMNKRERVRWERFGDLVYHHQGGGAFETRWP